MFLFAKRRSLWYTLSEVVDFPGRRGFFAYWWVPIKRLHVGRNSFTRLLPTIANSSTFTFSISTPTRRATVLPGDPLDLFP
jgi:hypothetical protein